MKRARFGKAGGLALSDCVVSNVAESPAVPAGPRMPELAGALNNGRGLLGRMPMPSNPRNHFVIDPAKWDLYATDCARRA